MAAMWLRIGLALKIDEPGPMGLYLGCIHEEGSVKMDDGKTVRTMTFNQEGFFREKVAKILGAVSRQGRQRGKARDSCYNTLCQRNSEGELRSEA